MPVSTDGDRLWRVSRSDSGIFWWPRQLSDRILASSLQRHLFPKKYFRPLKKGLGAAFALRKLVYTFLVFLHAIPNISNHGVLMKGFWLLS